MVASAESVRMSNPSERSSPSADSGPIDRYTRYLDLVDSLVPPLNSSWYQPAEPAGGPETSHRMREREFQRKLRAVNGVRP
jgi:hypothetical protein